MTRTIHLMSIFVVAGILIGSLSVSSSVFATYDKEGHTDQSGQSSSNANLYVNSLSFDFSDISGLDSCDAHPAPCILLNPLDSSDLNEVFIADPALLNTRTLVAVNVNEKDNFPTNSTASEIKDIFEYPECYIVTLAKFNDINGVFIECNKIDDGIIDVTYSFTDPKDDDARDDDHEEDHGDDYKNNHWDNSDKKDSYKDMNYKNSHKDK
ncbi:Hypothetical protein Nlim_1128 [Candidatus Nitrosarchaeum limnium SFB1]|jgi:hypothetical protein|uniref:Uncharacterized protein n=1 Tax=Candidatus Nitrosarchaeum limnium SFB1 TaxID=886738 RepID=F3KKV4_9ARCH|nr:Hypothetical protein Nlim_1128 [Candidatus Nitrosarchaeum limnium SFB1]